MHLSQFLLRSARARPDATAVSDPGGALSWAAFHDRVARLAGALQKRGLSPGARVAFLVAPGRDAATLYFAPIWAGLIMVPLNLRASTTELREALHLTEPELLIVDAGFREIGLAAAAGCDSLREVVVTGPGDGDLPGLDTLIAEAEPVPPTGVGGDAIAALFFTSGTTGQARAVKLSHGNIWLNSLCSAGYLRIDETATLLHVQPLFHLAGGARLFTSVMAGARQHFLPRFDAGAVLGAIPEVGASHIGLVPTMLAMLLDHPDCDGADLSSLRVVGYGAAPMTVALLERAMARLPEAGFVNSYGMTELSPLATCLTMADHREAAEGRPELLETVGRPVWNVEIGLRDEAGQPVPDGEPGEIVIRGPTVMHGYWGEDAADGPIRDGWYFSGDVGAFEPGGYLRLLDRKKDIIITGGENVASLEVENVLSRHPAVRECAVVGRPDPTWGEQVHAVVVTDTADCGALEAHCRAVLAAYKCPRSWDLRQTPLPRTSVGKIDKRKLRA